MAVVLEKEYLTFDDVLLQPSYSDIKSRQKISLEKNFLGLKLGLPIISANMDYVTGFRMAEAMHGAGGLGILHRFGEEIKLPRDLFIRSFGDAPVAFSVGVREPEVTLQLVAEICRYKPVIVCVDVAHGHHRQVRELLSSLKKLGVMIIAGNVATVNGYRYLADSGADAIKVGIGPGSVCTTREVTGVGVPQLSAIMEIAEHRRITYNDTSKGPEIIADGGIKNSGDIVKALAAGADVVMLGNLLAGCDECPGPLVVNPDGRKFKAYRGQSIFGTNGLRNSPEGISGYVEAKGPVGGILERLAGGVRSGMSYVGARNLDELQEAAIFVKVSAGTKIESSTRVKEHYG